MRMKYSLGIYVCVAMLFALFLAGCTAAKSVFGPDSTLFRHGRERSEKIEAAIAEWAGETEDWTGEDYVNYEAPEDVIRDYGAAQLDGAKLETCLVKNLWDTRDKHYYLVGADFSLPGERQEHWYVLPNELGAIYEYVGGAFQLIYPEHTPSRESPSPEWNLTDSQWTALTERLAEVSKSMPHELDYELRELVNPNVMEDPELAFPCFLSALKIDSRITQAGHRSLTSSDGRAFSAFTAGFLQDSEIVQRWFVMPDNVSSFYEYLPKTGLLIPLAESTTHSHRWFVREQLGLKDKVLQSLPNVDGEDEFYFAVAVGRVEEGEFILEETYYVTVTHNEIFRLEPDQKGLVSVWRI